MHPSIRAHVRPSTPAPRAARSIGRHALHRAVDHDWSARPSPSDRRGSLAAGLAMMATLPVVTLLLARWPDAPHGVTAAIASLPLLALMLCAVTWGTGGPSSEAAHHRRQGDA